MLDPTQPVTVVIGDITSTETGINIRPPTSRYLPKEILGIPVCRRESRA